MGAPALTPPARPRRQRRADAVTWLTARDAMWAAVRALGTVGPFTLTAAAVQAGVNRDTLDSYLRQLVRTGVLDKTPAPPGGRAFYRLVSDPGSDTPRVRADGTLDTSPTAQERLWLAMKPLGSFTVAELVLACAGAVSTTQATDYVGRLAAAGYLLCTDPCRRGADHRRARYRLSPSHDTGPRAPAIRRDKTVFDLNLGRPVGPEDVL